MHFHISFPTLGALLIILVAGISARLLFLKINYMPPIAPDSIGYYLRAQQLYQQPSLANFVGTARTPVFPLILGIPFLFRHELQIPLTRGSTLSGVNDLFLMQNVFNIISALFFFLILTKLQFHFITRLTLSLLLVTNMLLIPWEQTLLTEPWGVIWSVGYIAALLSFLKHPTYKKVAVFSIVSILGIFLRPAILPLGIVIPLLMIMFLTPLKKRIQAFTALVLIAGTVGSYTLLNGLVHHNFVFQSVSSINAMGRILSHNIPVTSTANTLFGKRVMYYRNGGYPLDPFSLLDNTPTSTTFDTQLQTFVNRTMLAAPLETIQSILVDLPNAVFAISAGAVINPTIVPYPVAQWLAFLQHLDQLILSFTIIITPLLLLPLLHHLRQFPHTVLAIIGLSLLLVILPTLLYNYEDFPRFFVPNIPLYLVLFGYFLELVIKWCHKFHLRNPRQGATIGKQNS